MSSPTSTPRFADLPDILTVPEVAKFLRISEELAYEAVRTGDLGSVKFGRRIVVPKAALAERLNQP
jgi:excisionase family DNA binding protein